MANLSDQDQDDLYSDDDLYMQSDSLGGGLDRNLNAADRRAHHNALERKRRDHIKDSFSSLRDSVPSLQGEKASRAQILKKAAEYIQYMRKKNTHVQSDIDDLMRTNKMLEDQIRQIEPTCGGSSGFSSLMNGDLSSSYDISENSNGSDGASTGGNSLDGRGSSLGGSAAGGIAAVPLNGLDNSSTASAPQVVVIKASEAGLIDGNLLQQQQQQHQAPQQPTQLIINGKMGPGTTLRTTGLSACQVLKNATQAPGTAFLVQNGPPPPMKPVSQPHVIHVTQGLAAANGPSLVNGTNGQSSIIISNGNGTAVSAVPTNGTRMTNGFVLNKGLTLPNGTPITIGSNGTIRTVMGATGVNGMVPTNSPNIHIVSTIPAGAYATSTIGPKTKKLKISHEATNGMITAAAATSIAN